MDNNSAGKPDGQTSSDPWRGLVPAVTEALQHTPIATYVLDLEGRIRNWNAYAEQLFGWSASEVTGRLDPTVDEDKARAMVDSDRLGLSAVGETMVRRRTKHGGSLDTITWMLPQLGADGQQIGVLVFVTDKFVRNDVYNNLRLAHAAIERVMRHANIAVFAIDLKTNTVLFGSSATERIYGYTQADFAENPALWREMIHPDDRPGVNTLPLTDSDPVHMEYRIIRKDGGVRWIEAYLYPQFDTGGVPTYLEAVTMDITERREAEEKLSKMAYTDLLTGLPNRVRFDEDLTRELDDSVANQTSFAVLYIDFDGFKYINDRFGHHFGDAVLRRIAKLLSRLSSDKVRCYRMGGDEFTVIVRDAQTEAEVRALAEQILQQFGTPLWIGDEQIRTRCSIGAAIYPQHGNSADVLLRRADIAMYASKEVGGHACCVYATDLSSNYRENLQLHSALSTALREGQFDLFYQPKIRVATGKLTGVEALIRWHAPHLGVIAPGAFIPFAEQSGLILDIGGWVLEQACRQNRAWQAQGLPPTRISVNVSMLQLEEPNFVPFLEDVLARTELDPKWLELEITESVLVKSMEQVSTVIDQIAALGVHVSVDDFGVGYSSLQYVAHLPVGTLKIDRSFIRNIESNANVKQVVTGIIQMAHTLDLQVVAEGVERDEQMQLLGQIECDEIQGYLILRPQPAADFEQFYRTLMEVPAASS